MMKSKEWSFGSKIVLSFILFQIASINPLLAQQKYEENWESLKKVDDSPEWIQDAKFGIYSHWGPSSLPIAMGDSVAGWYPRRMYEKGHYSFNFHKKTFGDQNKVGYKDLIPMFTAKNFDADEWAKIFKSSGARFAGPVAVHHDNFCMWDSKITPWNAVNMGPKRDIVGELATAIRKQNMKFFVSMHHSYSWQYYLPAFQYDAKDPKYADLYTEPHQPSDKPSEAFLDAWYKKIQEVTDQYSPDLTYFDMGLAGIPEKNRLKMGAYIYNHADKKNQESLIIWKKKSMAVGSGLEDYEVHYPMQKLDNFWITDLSTTNWFPFKYSHFEKANTLVDRLADIVSKNGAMLLNVPPDPTGRIPQSSQEILHEIGKWLAVNGEAIYSTRPWTIYGYGPYEKMDPTAATKPAWNDAAGSPFTSEDIRFTQSKDGKTLFAIGLDLPADKNIKITHLESIISQVKTVQLIGYPHPIKWKKEKNGIYFKYPKDAQFNDAYTVKIEIL